MEESNLILFFGRFHPLLVHLPIGFLMIAVLMEVAERVGWLANVRNAIVFALLLGVVSAVAASVLGFMLGTSGDYSPDMLDAHMWAGIVTTVVSAVALVLKVGWENFTKRQTQLYLGLLALVMTSLSATGHLGGNMTHGSDYLTYYMPFKPKTTDPLARPKVTDIQQAQLFGDLVHPIITNKCKSCHNQDKKKGGLSLSSIEDYLKGGKHGSLIVAGDPSSSELFHRVTLPSDHEEIMPPDGKTPLTKEEIAIIKFWLETGNADFDTLLVALDPDEEISNIALLQLQLGAEAGQSQLDLDTVSLDKIERLTALGYEVRELAAGSHAYEVTLNGTKIMKENRLHHHEALGLLKNNILSLKMRNCDLKDIDLEILSDMPVLQHLDLSQNTISDSGIQSLQHLPQLKCLNLYATQVTTLTIEHVAAWPQLSTVYIWQTNIDKESLASLRETHQNINLISGS
ncbi:Uncharacterized membrane protein [Reichenbachiella agariperforans]|uniref:Uncharacterized membrane protein n=1 Tax=Reichenbachiella agariperforans TaxID=156994 RepID=A0A1M6UFZ9_REIAG|nr:c-type cytochrome domain-containing protein [Reichenbachiella agariperforans]SHK68106.1 Uncharacterized membrane protein [Reichenbachiella agariperforans]